ncbi:MAG: hypothetical protein KDJ24_20050 [Gammaproteobacteria bacterium]|nr:hypothetical protein [Gammaproteobacteria bacterium]
MIESVVLVMAVVSTDGRELVSVRMPYETAAQCEAAAHAARWVIPDGYGLDAVAHCETDESGELAL